ncbi:uncharacterized protein LOC144663458 [Oculina patagonica]
MPVIAVLLMVSVIFRNISSQQCGIGTYSIYQMMLRGHTFKTFKARPRSMDCREACISDVQCQSYNYVMFKDICELNNRTKEARPEDFVKDRDRYYMKKASKRVPLGSIPELSAASCGEIKANEGAQAVSGDYWLYSKISGNSILAHCDMETGVSYSCNNGSCYSPFSDEKDWNNANTSCEANGAHLVKIESADENDFIKSLVGEVDYWIGLTDAETENEFKWSDGSELTGYKNWMSSDPNNYNNQDCVAIVNGNFYGAVYDGEWHDDKCSKAKGYICEK